MTANVLACAHIYGAELHCQRKMLATYAHIEIVVTFLVVNLFVFLVITRHHEGVKRCYQDRILPLIAPELPIPSRTFHSSNRP